MKQVHKTTNINKRKLKIKAKLKLTARYPRLSVHRSGKHIYAQIIDDHKKVTLINVSDREISGKDQVTKVQKAKSTGLLLAQKAVAKKITDVVFDRSGFRYHGRIKALADGAREGGLKF